MGKLKGKKPKQRQQEEAAPAPEPDYQQLEVGGRRIRSRRRQNNTILGTPPGRTLG